MEVTHVTTTRVISNVSFVTLTQSNISELYCVRIMYVINNVCDTYCPPLVLVLFLFPFCPFGPGYKRQIKM